MLSQQMLILLSDLLIKDFTADWQIGCTVDWQIGCTAGGQIGKQVAGQLGRLLMSKTEFYDAIKFFISSRFLTQQRSFFDRLARKAKKPISSKSAVLKILDLAHDKTPQLLTAIGCYNTYASLLGKVHYKTCSSY